MSQSSPQPGGMTQECALPTGGMTQECALII